MRSFKSTVIILVAVLVGLYPQTSRADSKDPGKTAHQALRVAKRANKSLTNLNSRFDELMNTMVVAFSSLGLTVHVGSNGEVSVTKDPGVPVRGVPGATGPQGPVGPQGPQGPQGEMGSGGIDGVTGVTGASGAQGSAGERGPQGEQGQAGPPGPVGPIGPIGPVGPQGPQGPKGDPGSVDFAGADSRYVNEGQVNSISGPMIQDGAVSYFDIEAGAVRSDLIAGGNILNGHLATGAVDSRIIVDQTVGVNDMAYYKKVCDNDPFYPAGLTNTCSCNSPEDRIVSWGAACFPGTTLQFVGGVYTQTLDVKCAYITVALPTLDRPDFIDIVCQRG